MKAMVFAAGLGTRLKPFTDHIPKALVSVAGKPMIQHTINYLINNGIGEVVINVHHFANQITGFLEENKNFGIDIKISDETEQLLDTGGGLSKASWFFDDGNPFLVLNVDILTNINISAFLQYHQQYNPVATLAVSNRETSRKFVFNSHNQLCGWRDHKTGRKIVSRPFGEGSRELAFSGLHIIDPRIFNYLKKDAKFSIIDTYMEISQKQNILAFEHESDFWVDMGNPAALKKGSDLITRIHDQ